MFELKESKDESFTSFNLTLEHQFASSCFEQSREPKLGAFPARPRRKFDLLLTAPAKEPQLGAQINY